MVELKQEQLKWRDYRQKYIQKLIKRGFPIPTIVWIMRMDKLSVNEKRIMDERVRKALAKKGQKKK